MTITAGLFQLDMIDHHAVLGFSLTADPKQVRKRYLKVARKLHPDSLRAASDQQRQLASELLSKQVNPAYEALSQDKSLKEHSILIKLKQKQLSANPSLVTIESESAKALLNAKDIESAYTAALEKKIATQFDDLTCVASAISEISELNAAYLICQQPTDKNTASGSAVPVGSVGASSNSSPTASLRQSLPKQSHQDTIIKSYLKRAQEFEAQRDYSRGILELREAIASHPKNARCHAYLSSLYLKSGQATLAKIHAKQALAFDPENQTAETVLSKLESESAKATSKPNANSTKTAKNAKGTQTGNKQRGGLLSGFFGGKKR
ncbi:MAG: DnaJ domain-containing protein [Phormidesmis sp.]